MSLYDRIPDNTADRVGELTGWAVALILCIGLVAYLGPYGLWLLVPALFLYAICDVSAACIFVAVISGCAIYLSFFNGWPDHITNHAHAILSISCYGMILGALYNIVVTQKMLVIPDQVADDVEFSAGLYGWSESRQNFEYAKMLYGKTPDQLGAECAEQKMNYLKIVLILTLPFVGYIWLGERGLGFSALLLAGICVPLRVWALPGWLYDSKWAPIGNIIGLVCAVNIYLSLGLYHWAALTTVIWALGVCFAISIKSCIYAPYEIGDLISDQSFSPRD